MIGVIAQGLSSALQYSRQITSKMLAGAQLPVGYSPPNNGFKSFYSATDVEKISFAESKGQKVLERYKKKLSTYLTGDLAKYKQDFLENFQDWQDFETYAWGETSSAVNDIYYDKQKGTLGIFSITFTPNEDGKINAAQFFVEAKLELQDSFMISQTAKGNLLGCTVKQDLVRYEKPFDMKTVAQAIAIACAPAIQGVGPVTMPPSLVNIINAMSASGLDAGAPTF